MVENSSKVAGGDMVAQLKQAGFLGEKCIPGVKASLDYFTTTYRQNIIFEEMKNMVEDYLKLWYRTA
jgi:hypothetical protein